MHNTPPNILEKPPFLHFHCQKTSLLFSIFSSPLCLPNITSSPRHFMLFRIRLLMMIIKNAIKRRIYVHTYATPLPPTRKGSMWGRATSALRGTETGEAAWKKKQKGKIITNRIKATLDNEGKNQPMATATGEGFFFFCESWATNSNIGVWRNEAMAAMMAAAFSLVWYVPAAPSLACFPRQ